MGYDMPVTYRVVGSTAEMVMTEIGKMFRWFKTEGYGADIAGLRREEPRLQDFGTWLRESSGLQRQELSEGVFVGNWTILSE